MDTFAKPLVDAGQLSGQLLVARHGTVVLERSFGHANRELNVPITPETRVCVASITKPMTFVVAHQLIDEGKLALSDTLGKWIAGFPSGDSITVEHLLRHRSGIPHRVTTEEDETAPLSPADVVELAKKSALLFPPGASNVYSSTGYIVLARVLELASGKSYAELMKERLFDPLGMAHSAHVSGRTILPLRATSYVPTLNGIENAALKDMSFLAGAGSIYSTARDVHRFVQAIVNGKLGEPILRNFMRQGRIAMNGSSNGFRAYAAYDSATGIEVIFAGNLQTGAVEAVCQAAPKMLAGENVATPTVPDFARAARLAPGTLERYEGVYVLGGSRQRLEARARNGFLSMADWILVPMSATTFVSIRDYGEVKAVFDAAGRFVRFDWRVGDETRPLEHVGPLEKTAGF